MTDETPKREFSLRNGHDDGWLAEKAQRETAEREPRPGESAFEWLARTGGKLKLEDKK